jgi:hypothetical protein
MQSGIQPYLVGPRRDAKAVALPFDVTLLNLLNFMEKNDALIIL